MSNVQGSQIINPVFAPLCMSALFLHIRASQSYSRCWANCQTHSLQTFGPIAMARRIYYDKHAGWPQSKAGEDRSRYSETTTNAVTMHLSTTSPMYSFQKFIT